MNVPTWRIGTRLLLAQTLVLVAAIATAGLIAALAGPPLFHAHMNHADHAPDPSQRVHVEDAYRTASAISLGLAAVTALSIAFVVSWYLTRRFQTALTNFITAAEEMSSGRYEARVAVDSAGPELDSLALAFNSMAGRLSQTEKTRRRLLSDLAHELRTPVATLAAYLEGLDDGVARHHLGQAAVGQHHAPDVVIELAAHVELDAREDGAFLEHIDGREVGYGIQPAGESLVCHLSAIQNVAWPYLPPT